MSLNVPQLPVVAVIDPRLQIGGPKPYIALKGSMINTFQTFNSNARSNSGCTINCNPPSMDTMFSRIVLKRFVYDGTITGTNTGSSNLLVQGFYGPRVNPIMSTTVSESMSFQNYSVTQQPIQQYWPSLLWYHNYHDNRFHQGSMAPSMLDQFQSYELGAGRARNPLAPYSDNVYENSRGGYSGLEILTNTSTSATFRLTVIEPIMLSPLVGGHGSNFMSSLGNIQSMTYSATFGQLERVLSLQRDQGASGVINITGVSVNVSSTELLMNFFSPDRLITPIPPQIESSYFSITQYPTGTNAAIAPGASVSLTMQAAQISSIPRRMYIFAGRAQSDKTPYQSDAFFGLNPTANPLRITWNTSQLLSQATTQDLYNISVKNGLDMSYSQFTNHVGAIICIDFGTDLSIPEPDLTAGSSGNFQMQLTCDFVNRHPTESIAPTLYVVVVNEGVMNIAKGEVSASLGPLSRDDVLSAKQSPDVSYKNSESVWGGSFWSKLRDGFSNAVKFVKDNKVVSTALGAFPHPGAQAAAQLARSVGLGASGGRARGRPRGRRAIRGGALDESFNDNNNVIDLSSLADDYDNQNEYYYEQ